MEINSFLQAHNRSIIVRTEIGPMELEMSRVAIIERTIEKISDDLSKEIMRRHKGSLIRIILRNPDLLRRCAEASMKWATKSFWRRSTPTE